MLRCCCGSACLLNFFQGLHGWSLKWLLWCFSKWFFFQKLSSQAARGCWVPSQEGISWEAGGPRVLGLGVPSLWVGSLQLGTTGIGARVSCPCGFMRAMLPAGLREAPALSPSDGSEEHWRCRASPWNRHLASPEFTACWLPEMENKNSVSIPVCVMTKGLCHQEGTSNSDSSGLGTQLPRSSTTKDISLWFHLVIRSLLRVC